MSPASIGIKQKIKPDSNEICKAVFTMPYLHLLTRNKKGTLAKLFTTHNTLTKLNTFHVNTRKLQVKVLLQKQQQAPEKLLKNTENEADAW